MNDSQGPPGHRLVNMAVSIGMQPLKGKIEITGLYPAGIEFQSGDQGILGEGLSNAAGCFGNLGAEKDGKPAFHDLFYNFSGGR
jgi:hypothetical protein